MRHHNPTSSSRLTDALIAASPDLLRYFQRRLQVDDAADGLAELMLAAWRRVDSTPHGAEQSRMWLFGIARHVMTNAARSERRRWSLAERFREVLRTSPTEGPPADDGAEVRDAIDRLSPAQAELVRLIHWDGFGVAEAAQILSISPSTARTRYQRARTDLRTALTDLLPEVKDRPSVKEQGPPAGLTAANSAGPIDLTENCHDRSHECLGRGETTRGLSYRDVRHDDQSTQQNRDCAPAMSYPAAGRGSIGPPISSASGEGSAAAIGTDHAVALMHFQIVV